MLTEKTDAELAADARMIVSALTRIRTEAAKRGIEMDLMAWEDGKVEVQIERVVRQRL